MSETTRTSQENPEQEQADFEFKILNDPEQRKLLMERVNTMVEIIEQDKYTNVIFLDKSARPLSTLCLDLWRKKFPDKKFPKINFMNIGREISNELSKKQGKMTIEDAESQGKIDEHKNWIRDVSPEEIIDAIGEEEIKRVKNSYKYLADAQKDNKVLVVEEISITGESRDLAEKILKTMFPDLNLETFTLATSQDQLFFVENMWGEAHNSPWRKKNDEQEYGITGVVDDEEHPLTAKPTREQSLDERLTPHNIDLTKQFKNLEDSIEHVRKSALRNILDFMDNRGETYDSCSKINSSDYLAIEIAKQYVKNVFLPVAKEAIPYIQELCLIGTINMETIAKIAEIINNIKPLDKKMSAAFYDVMKDFRGRAKQDNPSILDKILKGKNLTDRRDEIGSKVEIIIADIFRRGHEHYLVSELEGISINIANINYYNGLRDKVKMTDYAKLVSEFREELHHAVDEYLEKHQNRN